MAYQINWLISASQSQSTETGKIYEHWDADILPELKNTSGKALKDNVLLDLCTSALEASLLHVRQLRKA